jgi:hypothetical protein
MIRYGGTPSFPETRGRHLWRASDQEGDQTMATAARKRGLATMLFGLADAYEEQDR